MMGRRWRKRQRQGLIFFTECVLVVMHPDFEHPFIDAGFAAEFVNGVLVSLLHFPPDFLGEFEHFLLLKLSEFGAVALAAAGVEHLRRGSVNGAGNRGVVIRWGGGEAVAECQQHVRRGRVV